MLANIQYAGIFMINEEQPDRSVSVSRDFLSELDRGFQVWLSTITAGASPASLTLAYTDWLMHLALSPGKVLSLWLDASEKVLNFKPYLLFPQNSNGEPCVNPIPKDKRFEDIAWNQFPFNVYQQSFLSIGKWWQEAIAGLEGIDEHHREVVGFVNKQLLDALSPSNFIATNPVVLREIKNTFGLCLLKGFWHFLNDSKYFLSGKLPTHLQPLPSLILK